MSRKSRKYCSRYCCCLSTLPRSGEKRIRVVLNTHEGSYFDGALQVKENNVFNLLFKLKNVIGYICAIYLAPFIDISSKRYRISKYTFIE